MTSFTPITDQQLGLLRQRDLNAALVLAAVLRTGSVSAAARLVGMTQPAVSRAIDRLRQELADPLVVRQGNGVLPTARARAMQPSLESMLEQVHRALAPVNFDPATVRRDFRIAVNEHLQQVLMPQLLEYLATAAPGIRILARPIREAADVANLEDGHLDLIVGMLSSGSSLREKHLMTEPLVCVAERNLARKLASVRPLSLQAFGAHPQIDVQPAGLGQISGRLDAMFVSRKTARNVVTVLSSFGALMLALKAGRHIGVVPALAFTQSEWPTLRAVPVGFPIPQYRISAWWHNVAHHDPLLQWVLGHLKEVCDRVTSA